MAFDIKIKPLVLFDLEDKIKQYEFSSPGAGKRMAEAFFIEIKELQNYLQSTVSIYQSVRKYVMKKLSCQVFYLVDGETIFIIGLL